MQHRLIRHGSVDSTSERAFAALADGSARDGDVHVAESQTAGRGRHGRRWHSAGSEGLYASVILLPPVTLSAAGLTIAAGLAVHDAVARLGVEGAALDWPNDVIVRERNGGPESKLAGILVETRGLDPARPHYVVGIGLNVAQRSFPAELVAERAVTSLSLCGCDATVDEALAQLLDALPPRLESIRSAPHELARDYLAATGLGAVRVRVVSGETTLEGRIEAFDIGRGLVLIPEVGHARTFPLETLRAVDAI
jgi:BirA family biotin operon repressor/biotin-[acetyl-CoA-carboxylase] ligase